MAAAWAALVGIPLVRYIAAPLESGGETTPGEFNFTRVKPLDKLTPGKFEVASVLGDHVDAWSVLRNQAIGRVFIRLKEAAGHNPAEAQLDVFSTICPHSGCAVKTTEEKPPFVCGCHGARFAADGAAVPKADGGKNPSPRGLDPLPYRIEHDKATDTWWVAVEYREYLPGSSEQVLAYQRGTVDAGMSILTSIRSRNLYEVMDYLILTNHAVAEFVVVINERVWQGLTAAQQTCMLEAGRRVEAELRAQLQADEAAILTFIAEETGMQVIALTPDERLLWQEAAAPVRQSYLSAAGPLGAQLIEAIEAARQE